MGWKHVLLLPRWNLIIPTKHFSFELRQRQCLLHTGNGLGVSWHYPLLNEWPHCTSVFSFKNRQNHKNDMHAAELLKKQLIWHKAMFLRNYFFRLTAKHLQNNINENNSSQILLTLWGAGQMALRSVHPFHKDDSLNLNPWILCWGIIIIFISLGRKLT